MSLCRPDLCAACRGSGLGSPMALHEKTPRATHFVFRRLRSAREFGFGGRCSRLKGLASVFTRSELSTWRSVAREQSVCSYGDCALISSLVTPLWRAACCWGISALEVKKTTRSGIMLTWIATISHGSMCEFVSVIFNSPYFVSGFEFRQTFHFHVCQCSQHLIQLFWFIFCITFLSAFSHSLIVLIFIVWLTMSKPLLASNKM